MTTDIIIPEPILLDELARRGWEFEQMANGCCLDAHGEPISLAEFQLYLTTQRPSLFAPAYLTEPDTGEPYSLWPYQLESADYIAGGVVHEDGAEVGKTREITLLLLWSAFTGHGGRLRKPVNLVAAPLTSHLGEISRAIEEQVDLNPDLQAITRLTKGKRWMRYENNHLLMEFNTNCWIFFRPVGSDGNAFRGVHANGFCMFDEATKVKNPVVFSEFHRAMKPEATPRFYSVPDGDRSCEFFSMCQRAMAWEEFKRRWPNGYDGPGYPPMVRFNWPKTLMPDPFWNEARRRYYIQLYGGVDSAGYVRNVLGGWGDAESSAFPWATFGPCVVDIPEYRRLKVMVDASDGQVTLELTRFDAVMEGNRISGREVVLWERRESLANWERQDDCRESIESIVFAAFADMPRGENYAGADLGQTRDPTELLVKIRRGSTMRLHSRIQIRGCEYRHQCEFIRALDLLLDPDAERAAWGVDPGNAGTVVIGMLANEDRYQDRNFTMRLAGYAFGGGYDAVDLDGQLIVDEKTDKPIRQNGKELATDLLVMAMQKRRLQYPVDPELTLYYPSHTYKQGPRYRTFATTDDHVIDADRQLMLNVALGSYGVSDAFACGAHRR